jgi:phosphoesterase RecJ-like protein
VEKALDEAASQIRHESRIAVACHVGPDGDALGSILAVALALSRAGIAVQPSWGADDIVVPTQYSFLPGAELIIPPGAVEPADLFLAVDCASADRLGCLLDSFKAAPRRINVDHHLSNTMFGQVNVVDPTAASSAELVLRLIERVGAEIAPDVATCLYAGLVTDTGRFAYSTVTPRTHAVAGYLISKGVVVDEVSRAIFESLPFGYLKTLGVVLQRCDLTEDPALVVSWVSLEDIRAGGVTLDETEGFIDVVRSIREADIAAVLKQLDDGKWKVSLRSKGRTDVGAVAQLFGGGGHQLAAGYTSEEPLEESISALRRILRERGFTIGR